MDPRDPIFGMFPALLPSTSLRLTMPGWHIMAWLRKSFARAVARGGEAWLLRIVLRSTTPLFSPRGALYFRYGHVIEMTNGFGRLSSCIAFMFASAFEGELLGVVQACQALASEQKCVLLLGFTYCSKVAPVSPRLSGVTTHLARFKSLHVSTYVLLPFLVPVLKVR